MHKPNFLPDSKALKDALALAEPPPEETAAETVMQKDKA
jgi:hypothetical protein